MGGIGSNGGVGGSSRSGIRASSGAGSAARAACLAVTLAATAAAPPPAAAADGAADLRNTRYCEILPAYRDGLKLRVEVYNTVGHSDCPAAQWAALDAKALAEQLGAVEVILNGPRYWMMDTIRASGATADGPTKTFGDLVMTQRATISLPLRDILAPHQPYETRTIDRDTTYVFDAGKPVYEITDADGGVYVMQTYAQIVDETLTIDDLAGLGARLKLPDGWSYGTRVPDAPLTLTAAGKATLIQDELQNSYQKRN